MWKMTLAGAVVLAVAGSTLVYAQRANNPSQQLQPVARDQSFRGRLSEDDAQALVDARVAALKAGLRLTPEQEKNWPAVEAAIRDLAQQRFAMMKAHREERAERGQQPQQRDAIEFLRRRADAMSARAAGLKRLADASEPLYQSLDAGQKRRLAMLAWAMGPGLGGRHGGMGGGMHGGMGPGMQPGMGPGMGSGMGPGMGHGMGPGMAPMGPDHPGPRP
jgi:hypothetical protein